MTLVGICPRNIYLNLFGGAHFHLRSLKACNIAKKLVWTRFERLYFHEGFVHLNFRYCACFEQEVLKLESVDSLWNVRSSQRRYSVRKKVLKTFTKSTGKHLCQSHFFKKETLAQAFSSEFCEIPKNAFSTEQLLTTASDAYVT